MFKVFVMSMLFLSWQGVAKDSVSYFLKGEFNATDSITGIGFTLPIGPRYAAVKGEFVSSLNYAEVLDEDGDMQDFMAWDTGVRLGVYGKVFVYIEAGFDAFEIVSDDRRNDDDYYFDKTQKNNSVDGYAGLGAGINMPNMRIEGFIKARQIDGDYWDSDKQVFYGLQISMFY
ncbi:hypothetical protein GARC_0812 [Paraglaciecola arctica BSs20135]|uniref:Outer membrane protein beta-barrel domain-containing protein n=2 Tax=Paraglaciecola TaxID=1621534 RepID=K6YME5_9ALTE|nr:hypothetical protein GARC_0812 [Paraglaciecola arctica BSs20135]